MRVLARKGNFTLVCKEQTIAGSSQGPDNPSGEAALAADFSSIGRSSVVTGSLCFLLAPLRLQTSVKLPLRAKTRIFFDF